MDFENLSSVDLVELVMALEEAFPDLALPDDVEPEEMIRLIRERLGDDPGGEVAAFVRRKGPSSSGGASAAPED